MKPAHHNTLYLCRISCIFAVLSHGTTLWFGVGIYIRDGVAREQTEQLRRIYDTDKAKAFKHSQFETATFSGVYEKKCDGGLKKASGYVCFDIDHVSVQHVKDILMELKQFETVLIFTSPTGHGVKWVVNNRSIFKHVDFYNV